MTPTTSIQTSTITTRRSTGLRRYEYHDKIVAIDRGENPVLFPGEFVQYLLDKQGINPEELDHKLGYARDHFRSNIFNTMLNDGYTPLPKPFRAKMAAVTGTSRNLWLQRNFTKADAQGVTIDMESDLSHLIRAAKPDAARER